MPREHREQSSSVTPILDTILAKLPPLTLKLEQSMAQSMSVYQKACERLNKKLADGKLTQMDIEHELSNMPNVGGIEQVKKDLVSYIRMNISTYDIKKLPIEFLPEKSRYSIPLNKFFSKNQKALPNINIVDVTQVAPLIIYFIETFRKLWSKHQR